MKERFLSFLLLISFAFSVAAQTEKTRLIDEFARIPCGEFMARMDRYYNIDNNSTDSKMYVIYYDGKFSVGQAWNKKLKKFETKRSYPIRGNRLNQAKAIPLYLEKVHKLPKDKVVLIDGGFRESFMYEIWIVPKDGELPKPTPTVDAKDIIFKAGKPSKTSDYSQCYSGYE